jgi:hypothetical protein
MLVADSILSTAATGFGLAAATIAVFGFAAHIKPALSGAEERRIREATVIGGIGGLVVSLSVIILSAFVG